MVPDPAVGIDPAGAGAGVLALVVDAGAVSGAVCIDDTLGSAVGGTSDHLWEAATSALVSNSSWRMAVGAAGVWITWVRLNRFS